MTTCLGMSCSFGLPPVPFVNCCQFMYLVISLKKMILRAGCGIRLYQFLIIAYRFTLVQTDTDHTAPSLMNTLIWFIAGSPNLFVIITTTPEKQSNILEINVIKANLSNTRDDETGCLDCQTY